VIDNVIASASTDAEAGAYLIIFVLLLYGAIAFAAGRFGRETREYTRGFEKGYRKGHDDGERDALTRRRTAAQSPGLAPAATIRGVAPVSRSVGTERQSGRHHYG
jgi:hypothetical protein